MWGAPRCLTVQSSERRKIASTINYWNVLFFSVSVCALAPGSQRVSPRRRHRGYLAELGAKGPHRESYCFDEGWGNRTKDSGRALQIHRDDPQGKEISSRPRIRVGKK